MSPRTLARLGLVAAALALASFAVLHLLSWGRWPAVVSGYVNTPEAYWLPILGLLFLAAVGATTLAAVRTHPATVWMRLAAGAAGATALGAALAVLAPYDGGGIVGALHDAASRLLLYGPGIAAGLCVLANPARRGFFFHADAAFAVAIVAAAQGYYQGFAPAILERAALVLGVSWFVLLGSRVLRPSSAPADPVAALDPTPPAP